MMSYFLFHFFLHLTILEIRNYASMERERERERERESLLTLSIKKRKKNLDEKVLWSSM